MVQGGECFGKKKNVAYGKIAEEATTKKSWGVTGELGLAEWHLLGWEGDKVEKADTKTRNL